MELKADKTPVTLADTGAEKVIRETIKQAFPDHGFIGEEYGIEAGFIAIPLDHRPDRCNKKLYPKNSDLRHTDCPDEG